MQRERRIYKGWRGGSADQRSFISQIGGATACQVERAKLRGNVKVIIRTHSLISPQSLTRCFDRSEPYLEF
jgi:hypothetical protein